jgi:toxin YoeB
MKKLIYLYLCLLAFILGSCQFSDVQAYKKFESLIPELQEHPYTGTGHPHQLRHVNGIWSRKLDKKNRLRYMVNDTTVIVFIVSAIGHYDDK